MSNQMKRVAEYAEPRPAIKLHRPEDFESMRRAGRLAAEVLDYITPHVKAGVTTGELDRLCHEYILAHGAVPAPLQLRKFADQFQHRQERKRNRSDRDDINQRLGPILAEQPVDRRTGKGQRENDPQMVEYWH